MGYSEAAWERALKIQEVILRALSGEIHWFQAAEILGVSAPSCSGSTRGRCAGTDGGWTSGVTKGCLTAGIGSRLRGACR